jgi:hypothetical protein
MAVTVEITAGLMHATSERTDLEMEGSTLGEVLESIRREYPVLDQLIRDHQVQFFLNGDQFDIEGKESLPLPEGTWIELVYPLDGGR